MSGENFIRNIISILTISNNCMKILHATDLLTHYEVVVHQLFVLYMRVHRVRSAKMKGFYESYLT